MNKKLQIILVEDEPAILRGLSANITQFSADYEIAAATYNGVDALNTITLLKPDIVITDIRMPMMDGLELIEKARRTSPDTFFVILTGYAEFEYAKRAMKLQVTDYLLKPVDPDALEALLSRLKGELTERKEKESLRFLSRSLHADSAETADDNPITDSTLYLLFTFYGTVTSDLYNEIAAGNRIVRSSQYDFLDGISDSCCPLNTCSYPDFCRTQILPLHGNHRNETVFAIITNPDMSIPKIKRAAYQIHEHILSEDIFVNSILSEPIPGGNGIPAQMRNCYLYAAANIIFGQSRFFSLEIADGTSGNIAVTPKAKELLQLLKPVMLPADVKILCRSLTDTWETNEVTQLQLQTDLRFILNTVVRKTDPEHDMYPNPSELLAASSSYEELGQNLLLELGRLCTGRDKVPATIPHAEALAWKVRDYLDQNYTQSITYKNFTGIFGYNEKYLSYIFKEKFNISPSKYILELRMTAAKNLIRQNPDMLLKDIAEKVGYENQLYFSRVFKHSEGMSPREYQKKVGI